MRAAERVLLIGVGLCFVSGCAGGGVRNPFRDPEAEPIGYGVPERRDATGAVGSVAMGEIEPGHFADMAEFLQGRVAGLQVIRMPSGDVSLRIRGAHQSLRNDAEPLLVIDQMPVANLALALRGLRPQQVERVEVLKDVASTSVYGTRGAHGVILIGTKR